MLTKWTPLKLTQLALLGSIVMTSGVLLPTLALCLFSGLSGQHPGRFALGASSLVALASLLIGALLTGFAQWRLYPGLDKSRWTTQEVETAHRWIESATLTRVTKRILWAFRLLVFATLLYWVASYVRKFSLQSAFWVIFYLPIWLTLPLNILSKLRAALRPEPPPRDPPKGWAGTINGIYSEHWGGRKTPSSNPT